MKHVIFTFVIFLISCNEDIQLNELSNFEVNSIESNYSYNDDSYNTDSMSVIETETYNLYTIGKENESYYEIYVSSHIEDNKLIVDSIPLIIYNIRNKQGSNTSGNYLNNPSKNFQNITYTNNNNIIDITIYCEYRFNQSAFSDLLDSLYVLNADLSLHY